MPPARLSPAQPDAPTRTPPAVRLLRPNLHIASVKSMIRIR